MAWNIIGNSYNSNFDDNSNYYMHMIGYLQSSVTTTTIIQNSLLPINVKCSPTMPPIDRLVSIVLTPTSARDIGIYTRHRTDAVSDCDTTQEHAEAPHDNDSEETESVTSTNDEPIVENDSHLVGKLTNMDECDVTEVTTPVQADESFASNASTDTAASNELGPEEHISVVRSITDKVAQVLLTEYKQKPQSEGKNINFETSNTGDVTQNDSVCLETMEPSELAAECSSRNGDTKVNLATTYKQEESTAQCQLNAEQKVQISSSTAAPVTSASTSSSNSNSNSNTTQPLTRHLMNAVVNLEKRDLSHVDNKNLSPITTNMAAKCDDATRKSKSHINRPLRSRIKDISRRPKVSICF